MSTIDEMVNRFLAWKLPADFSPDGGVSFSTFYEPDSPHWPTGTNLLTAQQAKGMFTHALAGDSEMDRVTTNLNAAIATMRAACDDAERRAAGGDGRAARAVMHALMWGMANASSSIENALAAVEDGYDIMGLAEEQRQKPGPFGGPGTPNAVFGA